MCHKINNVLSIPVQIHKIVTHKAYGEKIYIKPGSQHPQVSFSLVYYIFQTGLTRDNTQNLHKPKENTE